MFKYQKNQKIILLIHLLHMRFGKFIQVIKLLVKILYLYLQEQLKNLQEARISSYCE